MADLGIGDDLPSDHALGNLVLLALRHCEYLRHDYRIGPHRRLYCLRPPSLPYGRGSVRRLILSRDRKGAMGA